jgi:hypothetical protein
MKRALVVSSGWRDVLWRANSAACVDQVLGQRGFRVRRLEDGEASRDSILSAYDDLIAHTEADDAAVFYYVGHGGRIDNIDYRVGDAVERDLRYICPSDFGANATEFRGICRFELAAKLAALSARTRNATVIFECCFAGLMSRTLAEHEVPVVPNDVVTAYLNRVRAELRTPTTPPGNPEAVSLSATDQSNEAYGIATPVDELAAFGIALDGTQRIGDFTLNLARALCGVGERRIPWRSLAPVIRNRMVFSRPELEGPTTRVPFSLETIDERSFGVHCGGGDATLEAGELHGVAIGDQYAVAADQPIGTLTIEAVDPLESRGCLATAPGATALPANARALPAQLVGPRLPVRVLGPDDVRAAVAATPRLRVAVSDEPTAVTLAVDGEHLRIDDPYGPIFVGAAERLPPAIAVLEDVAAARRLRAFAETFEPEATGFDVTLGLVTNGRLAPLPTLGAEVQVGAHVAIRLRNGSRSIRYAHVFGIGVDYNVHMFTFGDGLEVQPGTTEHLGVASDGTLVGHEIYWPPSVPRRLPRVDSVLVTLTAEPRDLSLLVKSREWIARGDEKPLPPFAMIWREYLLHAR